MMRKQLYREVAAYFKEAMPNAKTELHYDNPFQLLVAVILSAQCTDKRINQVTPRLFEDYPCAEAMAQASPEVTLTTRPSIWSKWLECFGKSMAEKCLKT